MRERPVTLPPSSIQRIRAGLATVDVIPVHPTPKRLDGAFDGTWAWPGNDHHYDDLTMATRIKEAATLRAGDRLRVYQARGKSHLTITTLMLELVEIRPQLMPWLEDQEAIAWGTLLTTEPPAHSSQPPHSSSSSATGPNATRTSPGMTPGYGASTSEW